MCNDSPIFVFFFPATFNAAVSWLYDKQIFCKIAVSTFLASYIKYTKLVFLTFPITLYSVHNPNRLLVMSIFTTMPTSIMDTENTNSVTEQAVRNRAGGEFYFTSPQYREWAMDNVSERPGICCVLVKYCSIQPTYCVLSRTTLHICK